MFRTVHLHRLPHGKCHADTVGAYRAFVPACTCNKMDFTGRFDRSHIAYDIEYHAIRIGQQHDRSGLDQQMRRRDKQALCGPHHVAVAAAKFFEHIAAHGKRR